MSRATSLERFKARLLPIALGAGAALLVTGVAAVWLLRDDTPRLSPAALQAAQDRWRAAGVTDYDLEIEIGGKRAGRVHLEVRGGEPTAMTRDGAAPAQRRTWGAWTVEGQFDTLRTELAAAADPAKGFGAPPGTQVVQRARFDDVLGYPLRYERYLMGTDHSLDIAWRVVRFQRR